MKLFLFITLAVVLSACQKPAVNTASVNTAEAPFDFMVTEADGSCATFAENARQQGYLAEIQDKTALGINPIVIVWRYKLDAACQAYVLSIRHR